MTEFVFNATALAETAIRGVEPALESDFVTVIDFLAANPDSARNFVNRPTGSAAYIDYLAFRYAAARAPRYPQIPSTVPDPAVSVVLRAHFGVDSRELDRIKSEHSLSMAAENIVGDLLERYIALNIEQSGWVWCAGEFVKSVDFVRPHANGWESLQVKNRDNSENSSSVQVRLGTSIEKWHRTVSRTGETRWDRFPALEGHSLHEDGFLEFVESYFQQNDLDWLSP